MKVSVFLLGLLLFQLPITGNSQSNWAPVIAKVESNRRYWGENYAITIAAADSVLLQKDNKVFNAKTPMPIGAISQWLTATLLVKLAEEGKLSLDDPVAMYLPTFEKYFKGYITIRHCLSQGTGLEDKSGLRMAHRTKFISLEEEVEQLATRPIIAKPGELFLYGELGSKIAGRVAEVVCKKKFDLLIRTKVLMPLGMRRTSFTNLSGGPLDPAAGAVSTGEDLVRFLQVLLNKGQLPQRSFLTTDAMDQLIQLQFGTTQTQNAPLLFQHYGFALGAWGLGTPAEGAQTLVASSRTGSWIAIDFCRRYVYVAIIKEKLSEEKDMLHQEMLDIINIQLANNCAENPS
ncbi:MAG: beta-lactamase family protein [Bacteroidetes bacterium]|nr:beta-lactamase family protein [Bacteroidota bacterium]